MSSPAKQSPVPGDAVRSDPMTVERIWGQRISQLGSGYSAAYNSERQVDERLLAQALSVKNPRGLALDVGSFYPETPKLLARMGWSVVCVDLSQGVCKRVQQISVEEGLPLWPVRCDAAMLPFRSRAFDLVTDLVTSVVTPHPDSVVDEEVRVLKPNALYVLVSNNRWTRSAKYNLRRQNAAGSRHPRWGYFSPLSPYDLLSFTWKYRLRLISIDSGVYSIDAIGLGLDIIGRLFPFLKRILGWRLGAVYVAPPEDEEPGIVRRYDRF